MMRSNRNVEKTKHDCFSLLWVGQLLLLMPMLQLAITWRHVSDPFKRFHLFEFLRNHQFTLSHFLYLSLANSHFHSFTLSFYQKLPFYILFVSSASFFSFLVLCPFSYPLSLFLPLSYRSLSCPFHHFPLSILSSVTLVYLITLSYFPVLFLHVIHSFSSFSLFLHPFSQTLSFSTVPPSSSPNSLFSSWSDDNSRFLQSGERVKDLVCAPSSSSSSSSSSPLGWCLNSFDGL